MKLKYKLNLQCFGGVGFDYDRTNLMNDMLSNSNFSDLFTVAGLQNEKVQTDTALLVQDAVEQLKNGRGFSKALVDSFANANKGLIDSEILYNLITSKANSSGGYYVHTGELGKEETLDARRGVEWRTYDGQQDVEKSDISTDSATRLSDKAAMVSGTVGQQTKNGRLNQRQVTRTSEGETNSGRLSRGKQARQYRYVGTNTSTKR